MRARARTFAAILVPVAAVGSAPTEGVGQVGVVVEGRVVEADGGRGISLAAVELEGAGGTLTTPDGAFRFEAVSPGAYPLRVVAFGYAPESTVVVVDADTSLLVQLEPTALPVDSLLVRLRAIEIEGTVRDPEKDFSVVDVAVLTSQGRATRTDSHGRFALEGVLEGVPLHVTIRAFGYLPLDSVVVPSEDATYVFDLEADSLVEAMVAVQVERLQRRASPRFVAGFRNLGRDRLVRYAGSATVWDVLLFEYGERRLERVSRGCVLIDERQHEVGPATRALLMHLLPEELERIEFMFGGSMLRIYTREFMQQMIARDVPLRRPFMFGGICL